MRHVAAIALALATAVAAPREARAQDPCDACVFVYFGGIFVTAFCLPGGGGTLAGCQSDGQVCWGSSCSWAAADFVPVLRHLASTAGAGRVLERVVAANQTYLAWDAQLHAVAVSDCFGRQIALIPVARERPRGSLSTRM